LIWRHIIKNAALHQLVQEFDQLPPFRLSPGDRGVMRNGLLRSAQVTRAVTRGLKIYLRTI